MTTLHLTYDGEFRTTVTHEQSGSEFVTDAPTDHNGLGRSCAPTDLLAASIGSASLTFLAIKARKLHYPELLGATCTVTKTIAPEPPRRVSRLDVTIHLPDHLNAREVRELRWLVYENPVYLSISGSIDIRYYWN